MTSEILQIETFEFPLHLDVRDRRSIKGVLSDDEAYCLYVYKFADGEWYVGKSIDVRERFVRHNHEWRNEDPSPIPVELWICPFQGTEKQLEIAEKQAIYSFGLNHKLKNITNTGWPYGASEIVLKDAGNADIPISKKRLDRPLSTVQYSFDASEVKAYKSKRFEKMKKDPDYEQALRILKRYVLETIPAPANFAGSLWIVTNYTKTSGFTRFCCISCSIVETLVLFPRDPNTQEDAWGFINIVPTEAGKLPRWKYKEEGIYDSMPNLVTLSFNSFDEIEKILANETMLECCYLANSGLMRHGPAAHLNTNNPYLTEAILPKVEEEKLSRATKHKPSSNEKPTLFTFLNNIFK